MKVKHAYCKKNLRNLKLDNEASCENCDFSERTTYLDGGDVLICRAALYDIKTLACFVPKRGNKVSEMDDLKPCPVGNKRCLCADCADNANYDDCSHGYCLGCFECIDAGKQMHDVYACTGYNRRADNGTY